MRPSEKIKKYKQSIEDIFKESEKNGITNIRIFGSVARKEDTEKSDLDLVVSVKNKPYLLKVLGLRERLQDLLGIDIDIVVEEGLPDDFKSILKEAIQYNELIQWNKKNYGSNSIIEDQYNMLEDFWVKTSKIFK